LPLFVFLLLVPVHWHQQLQMLLFAFHCNQLLLDIKRCSIAQRQPEDDSSHQQFYLKLMIKELNAVSFAHQFPGLSVSSELDIHICSVNQKFSNDIFACMLEKGRVLQDRKSFSVDGEFFATF
jgi:hypothetical protein